MIDISAIRLQPEVVKQNLARRGVESNVVEKLFAVDEAWRKGVEEVEQIRARQNEANQQIAASSADQKKILIQKTQTLSDQEKELTVQVEKEGKEREMLWRSLPNLVQDDVPEGGAADFKIMYQSDVPPRQEGWLRDYLTLAGPSLDIERAAKVSGSRFVYILDSLARLELALVSYIFDTLAGQGFMPVFPPVLIKEEAMAGMGYLDHGADEVYRTQDNLYLVGTSEQSIGPLHMHEVFEAQDLPKRYVAFSSCFRREAGSHGQDVKGILRLHQFEKVEMFSFTSPDASLEEHEFLLQQQKDIMDALGLPYRVVMLAAGDLGAPSAKTYDIETWIPSEKKYRETHSTSNTTDYQARRLNIRVRTAAGEVEKVHLLNGTAAAMSRLLIALLENHQQEDGSIAIPAVLHTYLPFTSIPATRQAR